MRGLQVTVQHLRHEYTGENERVVALDDVSLAVGPGGRLTIVGPSGSGKSTLLAVLAGLQRPTSGSVVVGDAEVTRLSQSELLALRRGTLSVVVQDPRRNLLPYGTALDNIRFAQRPAGSTSRRSDPVQLLAALGIEHLAHARVDRLSGGERQRVALATGLALEPGVLLVDEPTSALDAAARDDVLQMLESVSHERGTTLVVITHDPAVADRLGGMIALKAGRTVEA